MILAASILHGLPLVFTTWKSVSYFPSLDGWLLDCQWSSVSLSHLQRCLPFKELVSQETSLYTRKYLECCWQHTYHFPLKPRGIGLWQGDMALCLCPSCDSFLPVAKYLKSRFSQVPPFQICSRTPGVPPAWQGIHLSSQLLPASKCEGSDSTALWC